MKKHRIKNFLKFGVLLFGVLIILTNCEKDDSNNNQVAILSNTMSFKHQKVKSPTVYKNKNLIRKIDSIKLNKTISKSNNASKKAYKPDLDFTIDIDAANYIEYGAYHSYTFPISRADNTDLVENLLLSLQADNTYLAYLVAYNLSEEEKQLLENGVEINLEDKVSFTLLQDQNLGNSLFSRNTDNGICYDPITITPQCPYLGKHSAKNIEDGQQCQFIDEGGTIAQAFIVASFVDCPDSGGMGFNLGDDTDSGFDDYGNPTNNGGGGLGTGDPNQPDPDDDDDDDEPEDCLRLDINGNCVGDITIIIVPDSDDDDDDCNTSKEDLKKVFPNISDVDASTLASVINDKGEDFGIDTKEKLQHFLSQAGHEVGGFNNGFGVEESTKYTTKARLLKIFGKYYSETDTINKKKPGTYVNNPSGHANYVYCCRNGNGNVASGDGYKYRGRGIFQLTGKTNYTNFKTWYNNKYDPDKDFVSSPELLKDNDTIAILSALWYYKTSVVDKITIDSTTTVKKVTKKVNGGINGLADRKEIFTKAKDSIDCN